jgi:hypothetical protein
MKKTTSKVVKAGPLSPSQQLEVLIAKVARETQPLFRSVRKALRQRFPSANELVYDYSHALVISYSPNENGIEAVVALSAGVDGLRLYFMNGPKLPDPKKLLQGSAKQTRYVLIESLKTLKTPDVEGFLVAAAGAAKTPFSRTGDGKLVIKTSSVNKKSKARKPKPKKSVGQRRAGARG